MLILPITVRDDGGGSDLFSHIGRGNTFFFRACGESSFYWIRYHRFPSADGRELLGQLDLLCSFGCCDAMLDELRGLAVSDCH